MHNTLIINGKQKLSGDVEISSAKNSALPLLAASLLTSNSVYLSKLPQITDVKNFKALLSKLGVSISNDHHLTKLNASNINVDSCVDYKEVSAMRASILLLGPLLSRLGTIAIELPGGCNIGQRPINEHINALIKMKANIQVKSNMIFAKTEKSRLIGAEVKFSVPTVTGTENIIMAASLAEGITTIKNAAKEPEIYDLANMLNMMGARITGAGSSTIQIEGVKELFGCHYQPIPDRVETATYIISALVTGSEITLTQTNPKLLMTEINHFRKMGANIKTTETKVVIAKPTTQLQAIDLTTSAYPGFATDIQAPTVIAHLIAKKNSIITETIFDNRLSHIQELSKMGANIKQTGNSIYISGGAQLNGCDVYATDLRASASLVIAALAAEGQSVIHHIHHLDRGYSCFDEKLKALGADIYRPHTTILPKAKSSATNTIHTT
ncbi:UDP-N-acetylglucosamine 1-carboxyvinyltransferase [Thiotrichales bacterium 19S9-12]|nr:UDP-N-acetylglucosamine 1-carboxyvinyltransferase [Thiotrichales bacterium 19S9-11]MCF6811635.1 UDP-N-acetylglucosamine 1-carboxyvinyltransferase [Thiotrichales bacterium 19S9-12]